MGKEILLYAGIIIATGLLFGKLAKLLRLPNVTGYLLGGLLIGPSVLNLIDEQALPSLEIISTIALGFIAFSIGSELKLSYFKKVGTKPIVIAVLEATLAVVFVFVGLLIYYSLSGKLDNEHVRFALVLGSIAAATAPAATLMVIRQYKARGKVTETLMSVVAIDDSVAVLLFGIGIAIANAINPTVEHSSVFMTILTPVIEIVVSLGIGGILGLVLVFGCKWFTGRGNRISLVVAMVFLTIYLSHVAEGSPILACMMLGAVFANMSKKSEEVHKLVYLTTPWIYIIFFVLSGVELNLSVFSTVGVVAILYIILRVLGKYFGAAFGAKVTKADPKVKKHLGFMLIPQAGVAIGLSLVAKGAFMTPGEEYLGDQIRAIILAATVIYELAGPIITKLTLKKCGEITMIR